MKVTFLIYPARPSERYYLPTQYRSEEKDNRTRTIFIFYVQRCLDLEKTYTEKP